MPFTLTMPKLSPTMEGGTIVKWHKKEGDQVKADEVLFEVATDKATVEYTAIDEGYLRKILVGEGEEAVLNQAVAIFTESADERIEGYEPEGVKKAEEPTAKKEEVKETATAAAPTTGLSQPSFVPEPPLASYEPAFTETPIEGRLRSSPLARRLARQKGIDLSTIKGTGPGGRVTSHDIDLGQPDAIVAFGRREAATLPPGTYEEEKLTPMRKAIGDRLQASKTFIPHFYTQVDVDVRPLVSVREQLKMASVSITFNDFILRASALALKEHPNINSGFNSANQTIIRFKTIDIAVAVTIDEGLITPIVHHADTKSLGQISAEVRSLASQAKEGKLAPEQYRGGSFTVSNLGMFGVRDFQAVINPPQAAILAVGGIRDVPVVDHNSVIPGKVLTFSLSSDHRVIDGASAAQFLQTLKKLLENPAVLVV